MMDNFELKKKSDLHLSRKLWHACGIGLMVVIYSTAGHRVASLILFAAAAVVIPIDQLRRTKPALNRLAINLLGPVMRNHEMKQLSGMTYLIMGTAYLLLFFGQHLVMLTLLFLAIGDPVASFFGIRYGKDKIIGNKTLQGTMASFVICTVVAALYYYYQNVMTERLLIVAPLSGLIGAAAEVIPVGKLDDNLTFPIICSTLLWGLFHLFGGFGV